MELQLQWWAALFENQRKSGQVRASHSATQPRPWAIVSFWDCQRPRRQVRCGPLVLL